MRLSILIGFLSSLALLTVAAASPEADDERTIVDAKGTIVQVGELGYGIEPDGSPGSRYAPDALPDEFREDGLRVVFSGEVGEIPEGGRRWGTPLRLTAIRRLEAPAPDDAGP